MNRVGLFVSTQEQSELFRHYDQNQDGQISVVEFLAGLQESISDSRLSIVKQSWQFLDRHKRGYVEVVQLRQLYNDLKHPRVLTREKTREEVRQEFENALQKYSQGQVLTEEGFLTYYASLSATIPLENENYFQDLLLNCWELNSLQSSVSQAKLVEIEDLICEKIRQRLRGDEDEGRAMSKTFRKFDRDNTGTITLQEFMSVLENWGCHLSEAEARVLFNKYDTDGSNTIVYEELAGAFARRGAGDRHQFKQRRELPKALISKLKDEILRRGTVRDLEVLLSRMDTNGDGVLSKHEFE